ncbi:Imm53 family immunity protein [Xenorhabdus griffiniae]|uniref:Imm53 family immunity protein n=1 Tax=Xenorhabdus griffiniae TaxID=351672 RepID=A0ABY9XJW4_9GAMM|nr:Imm53 family immunity protein [Xenorhabdus griffiniae]MBD1227470.1 hypothetical protein [Xenorhabdus griffiniae]MBE8589295.1 hypothetical protein [Xenorhabdus griffiniae]WMV73203.1 Imm53 family immunity protein [Xenorhabdus griffiniae]WNH02882.1 Imm53 family immunity protein [Xenorhabdus griffiniae]
MDTLVFRGDYHWINIKADDKEFKGYGGPQNLNTVLEYAMKWINPFTIK